MKLLLVIFAAALLLGLTAPGRTQSTQQASAETGAQVVPLDRIIAIVNDGVILQSDLDNETRTIVRELRRAKRRVPPADVLRKQLLERLILTEVQVQRAARLGIKVTDAQVNEALTRVARNNKLSLAQFHETLLKEGYDYENFRDNVRRELIIQNVRRREVEERITLSEQEVEEHLVVNQQDSRKDMQHHLRHLLIAVPEGADADAIDTANARVTELRDELVAGADFAVLASEFSAGQRALEGGDLGWRTFAQMPSLFAAAVEDMGVGDVSKPLRSSLGFHLIKLEAVRGAEQHVVDQSHARHILLTTNVVRDDREAQAELTRLRKRIVDGEDFAALARAMSEDYSNAIDGGDLGWFAPGVMHPKFQAVVDSLQPGELSQPFQTSFGWHLVELLERRTEDNTEKYLIDEAREQLYRIRVDLEGERWLRRLRDEAYVEYVQPDSS